jgi:hypothetical protein
MISPIRLVRSGMRIMDRMSFPVRNGSGLTNSSTSLAAHAAPLGMSYPPPAAQHQQSYQSSIPHSRSQDLYPRQGLNQQEYRPQPHPVQRQRTPAPDIYGSYDDTPSLMPYDIPDRSHSQSQSQQSYTQSEQYRSRSPVYQTQANAGHGWGGGGQGQRRF